VVTGVYSLFSSLFRALIEGGRRGMEQHESKGNRMERVNGSGGKAESGRRNFSSFNMTCVWFSGGANEAEDGYGLGF